MTFLEFKTLGSAAVYYASELQWFLFPIKPGTKLPLVAWSKLATNDVEQIKAWWRKWPLANIGLDCGRSGITVVDVDQHSADKNGRQSLDALELYFGDLPSKLRATTPSDGMHYFFRGTGRNTVSELGPGIDTRGKGGMVLLAPSRTPKGVYKWI